MFEEFFRFSGQPFKLNPDPKFFFGSRSHNKAMAYLHYGLRQAEGFIVITGEIGAGKSMLIGQLIDQLDRTNVVAAHLLTPNLKPENLLTHVLSAFRIEPAGEGAAAEIEAFEDFLFDQLNRGRRVLLIVDEAQNLPKETLEELRILSNLDYDGTPLFQVFLVGQPEFKEILAGDDMEQLRQRVIASYHLDPLGAEETRHYVQHRLRVVAWDNDPRIDEDAFQCIFSATGGVPRKINKLCNRILLAAAIDERHVIDAEHVSAVVSDLAIEDFRQDSWAAADDMSEAPPIVVSKPSPIKIEDIEDAVASDVKTDSTQGPCYVDDVGEKNVKDEVVKIEAEHEETSITEETAAVAAQASNVLTAQKSIAEEAQEAVSAPMSVLDRLRAQRAGRATQLDRAASSAPSPATMNDVAAAIAAANAGSLEEIGSDEPAQGPTLAIDNTISVEASSAVEADANEVDEFDFESEPKGKTKQLVTEKILQTRDDLKHAHANVAKIRRRLQDHEERRLASRRKITASLDRAEALLTEFRDIWR